jgi:hypothetical protein
VAIGTESGDCGNVEIPNVDSHIPTADTASECLCVSAPLRRNNHPA